MSKVLGLGDPKLESVGRGVGGNGTDAGPLFVVRRKRGPFSYLFISRSPLSGFVGTCRYAPPLLYPYIETGMKAGAASYERDAKSLTSGVKFIYFSIPIRGRGPDSGRR